MKKWFEERNLKQLDYQKEALEKVESSLREKEITVLASSPSSGKTIMSIYTIDKYLESNPGHKVLVLAHGTTVLRTQFHNDIEETMPNFSSNLVISYVDYNEELDVNVCLPQTLYNKEIPEIDLLVVDEAHQFYFADMVQSIIKKGQPQRQLLLTGTPSPFVKRGLNIIPISLNDIMEEGMVSDLFVQIATSSYSFDPVNDYNQDDELKSSIYIKKSETNKTLDSLLSNIVEKLNLIDDGKYEDKWVSTLNNLHKTMFACKSQNQARQVKAYFDRLGINSALSISEIDIDSSEITRFKDESDCLVLIVVARGILGFNYPDLVNIVDLTTSQNIDRIYQLMARVIRKHPRGKKKLFFKIAANGYTDYYKHIMTAVLSLADKKYFTKFNGKNFKEMKIPVIRVGEQMKVGTQFKQKRKDEETKETVSVKPIEFEGLPAFQFFKDTFIENQTLNIYAYTTLRNVRNELLGTNTLWTLEKCKKSAMKYKRPIEWVKNDVNAYCAAQRNGWIKKCTSNMTMNVKWRLENCQLSASKYERPVDWQIGDANAYSAARRYGWLEKCTSHMTRHKKWTLKKCKESAMRYSRPIDWQKNENNVYSAAARNGWIKECTSHMNRQKQWSKESCLESALKYSTIKDWRKGDLNAYCLALRKKWIKKCTAHMTSARKKWTIEQCKESALSFNRPSDWQKSDNNIYHAAARNGWIEECTSHMKRRKKSA